MQRSLVGGVPAKSTKMVASPAGHRRGDDLAKSSVWRQYWRGGVMHRFNSRCTYQSQGAPAGT